MNKDDKFEEKLKTLCVRNNTTKDLNETLVIRTKNNKFQEIVNIKILFQFPNVISLNVGGYIFTTSLSTLLKYEDSMLAVMFSGRHDIVKDENGHYFIDRDGKYFR